MCDITNDSCYVERMEYKVPLVHMKEKGKTRIFTEKEREGGREGYRQFLFMLPLVQVHLTLSKDGKEIYSRVAREWKHVQCRLPDKRYLLQFQGRTGIPDMNLQEEKRRSLN